MGLDSQVTVSYIQQIPFGGHHLAGLGYSDRGYLGSPAAESRWSFAAFALLSPFPCHLPDLTYCPISACSAIFTLGLTFPGFVMAAFPETIKSRLSLVSKLAYQWPPEFLCAQFCDEVLPRRHFTGQVHTCLSARLCSRAAHVLARAYLLFTYANTGPSCFSPSLQQRFSYV